MLEITVKKNPFKETLVSKEELFADFAEFATRKKELGQNALLAYYGLCHGEAIMKFCDGKVDDLMKHAGIPKTSIAYFQAGLNAWKNLYEGLTVLPESSIYTLNPKNKTVDELKNLPVQQIFYGAPGTGKSHRIKEIIKQHGIDEKEQVIRTTFHPDSDYSTFVGCYKPIMKKVPQTYVVEGKEKPVIDIATSQQSQKAEIVYDYTPQAFVQAYTKAWANPDKSIILVIEEINRGNCAQIFGDIFQLLDRGDDGVSDYEIKPDNALEVYLKGYFVGKDDVPEDIRNGEIMKLPANLFIWATMNTSDQSLFPIDSAFKRRWEWKYLPINNHEDKNYKIEIGGTKYDWWGFLSKINEVISNTTSSEDKKLGYFFAKANTNGIVTAEQFVGKVLFYLWNDVFKNYGFDNQIFDKGDKKKFDFSDFFKQDGSPNTDVVNKFLGKLDETIDKENSFVEKTKDDKGQEEPSDTEA